MKQTLEQFIDQKYEEFEAEVTKSRKHYFSEKEAETWDKMFGPGTSARMAKYEGEHFSMLYRQAVERDRSGGMDIDARDFRGDARQFAFDCVMAEEYAKLS